MPKERSDHLFTLIRSMRKNEKRYFKVRNKGQNQDDAKYLMLFDALDKMEAFDEDLIIRTLK